MNSLITKLNGLGLKANGLLGTLGVSIPQIPQIPLLAQGGDMYRGSAIVGDAGPEVLTMKNGHAEVRPLSQTTNTYNTYNNTSQRPLDITLDIDAMKLARILYEPMKQVEKQYGPSFVR